MQRKTNPDHKARVRRGVQYACSCGWESSIWLGKGAQGNASSEWHTHRDKCENPPPLLTEQGIAALCRLASQ